MAKSDDAYQRDPEDSNDSIGKGYFKALARADADTKTLCKSTKDLWFMTGMHHIWYEEEYFGILGRIDAMSSSYFESVSRDTMTKDRQAWYKKGYEGQ